MRAALVVAVVTLFLAGGCASASPKHAGPAGSPPESRRSSHAGSGDPQFPSPPGRAPAQEPEDEYNTTFLTEFDLHTSPVPFGQGDNRLVPIGGNYTLIRIKTTFYLTGLQPFHSGHLGIVANPLAQQPGIQGVWQNGTILVVHAMKSNTIYIGNTGTRVEEQRTFAGVSHDSNQASFTTFGWGDINAKILIEIVNGKNPKSNQTREK